MSATLIIDVYFDLFKSNRIETEDRIIVPKRTKVMWKFISPLNSEFENRDRWRFEIEFDKLSPFDWSSIRSSSEDVRTSRQDREVITTVDGGKPDPEQPGEYKYTIRAVDQFYGRRYDEDPYLIFL